MSKTQITFFIAFLISISIFAQQGINYKALIKDGSGTVVSSQEIDIRFEIIEGFTPFSTIVYAEDHLNVMTDVNGIIILNIGEGAPTNNTFADIDWDSGTHSLITKIDLEDDGTFVSLPETPFKTVPYAIQAKNVKHITGIVEGNGIGWRLIDVDSDNYGPIGENAIDLSYSSSESTTRGATGESSTALGINNIASGKYSTALGLGTTASGIYSTALGYATKSESFRSVAIGSYNIGGGYAGVPTNPNSTLSWVSTDPLFEIGNGRNTRSNALTVLKNGNVGIGRHQPTSLLEVTHNNIAPTSSNLLNAFSIRNSEGESWQFYTQFNGNLHLYNNGTYRGAFLASSGAYLQTSDRRLKKDITPLNNKTLEKVMQLNPVSYLMKDQTDSKRNLGLISQEVQEIFPSITHYVEESDLLTLSYTELIPILIKALQEQQDIIDKQNSKLDNVEKHLSILSKRLENLEAVNN